MITCELQGKLGNMMFQIAAIEDMGYRTGIQTCYPHVDKNIEDLKKPQSCTSELNGRKYFKIFKTFDWHKNHDKPVRIRKTVNVPFHYIPIVPIDNTCYIGYFQSELYFKNRDLILKIFEPAAYIKEQVERYRDVIGVNKASIHVRRGDYIKLSNIYNVLDMNYYNQAMKILNICGVTEYLVFSTDIQWCKENFKGDQFTFIHDNSFVELFLMSQCAHQVIANSAFSWWGAYLNTNPNKTVVAPAKWFSTTNISDKDIIPNTWIKI